MTGVKRKTLEAADELQMFGRAHAFVNEKDEKTGRNKGQGEDDANGREQFHGGSVLQFTIDLNVTLRQRMTPTSDAVTTQVNRLILLEEKGA